jgi:hypothetical protein
MMKNQKKIGIWQEVHYDKGREPIKEVQHTGSENVFLVINCYNYAKVNELFYTG